MRYFRIIIISCFTILYASTVFAEITVTKVKGSAAYREGIKWLPLREKMKLTEGVRICTGTNSYADISLNSVNHTIRIKPYTTIQVFSKETADETYTYIGLKRGGINAKVPKHAKVKTIFRVATPVAVSSVRGTEENIFYGPDSGMIIEVVKGVVEGSNRLGRNNLLAGRLKFIQLFNEGQPQDILMHVKNRSLITIYGSGLTPEEKAVILYSCGDQTGSPDDDNEIPGPSNANTKINISPTWH